MTLPPKSEEEEESVIADGMEVAEALLEEARRHVAEMEDLEDYYFGADRGERMRKAIAVVDSCVERALWDSPSNKMRVDAFYLKGRAASLVEGKERVAEDFLSKALKLEPQRIDAWNVLGEVYWNQQHFTQARKAFEKALELCGPNPVTLRNLSMVLRALESPTTSGSNSDQESAARRSDNYTLALEKAKEAVALGPNDAQNWETLGNAYVGDFFVNARRPDEIKRALIAYDKAESACEKLGKRNPTLHLNRARAAKYIEDYALALRSFQKAHEIGAVGAAEEGQRVLELVRRLAGYASRKGDLKGKLLKELMVGFPENSRTLQKLQKGEFAPADVLAGRMVALIDQNDDTPVIVVCCDATGEFFAVSIYNVERSKVAEALIPLKSLLNIHNPKLRQISVTCSAGKQLSYPCVYVVLPGDIFIAGGGSLGRTAVKSVISTGVQRSLAPATPTSQQVALTAH